LYTRISSKNTNTNIFKKGLRISFIKARKVARGFGQPKGLDEKLIVAFMSSKGNFLGLSSCTSKISSTPKFL